MFLNRITDFLHAKIVIILIALVVIGFAIALGSWGYLSSVIIESIAMEEAKQFSITFTEIRSLYTREVVSRVAGHGIEISHDYNSREGAIPLPATFTMLLGERLLEAESQVQIRLYSDYPFPWRKKGGPRNDFEKEALRRVKQDPTQPYSRLDSMNGITVFRYATADLMRAECVSCHNTHPDTPKTGWKEGDVRGVLEIIYPVSFIGGPIHNSFLVALIVCFVVGGIGMGGVTLVLSRLRKDSRDLETRVSQRTMELALANQELEKEISERKAAEIQFKSLFESSPDLITIVNEEGKILLANAQTEPMVGYASQELIGQHVDLLIPDRFLSQHSDHRAAFHQNPMKRAMGQNQTRYIKRKDGSECPIEITLGSIKTEKETWVVCCIRDVTERKRIEEALLEVSRQNTQILNSMAWGIYGLDLEGKTTFVNQAAASMIGWEPKELLGKPQHAIIHHSKHDGTPYPQKECPIYSALRDGRSHKKDDEVFWRKDRTSFPVEYCNRPIKNEQGKLVGTVVTFEDITEKKKVMEDLLNAISYTDQLLSSIPSILIGIDLDGIIIRWNYVAETTFGVSTQDAKGKNILKAVTSWDGETVQRKIRESQTTNTPLRMDDLPYTTLSGQAGILGLTISPILNTESEKTGFLILGADLTERKQLEVQLALAQKMESIGQLAAGIAHEINTPTQFVSDNLRFLQDSWGAIQTVLTVYADVLQTLPPGSVPAPLVERIEATVAEADMEYVTEEIPKALKQALGGADRVATIVRAMKDFSHPGTGEKKPIDLNKAIENTIMVARNEWKYVAEIVTDLAPTLPLVSCLPGEINQVILNLLVNAAHAVGEVVGKEEEQKGTITISTQAEKEGVAIRVADTGMGMSEAVRRRIFDPFFTTKEVGKGTGQGLAIVHDVVVTKHGGMVEVETAEGVGTTFLIRLPLAYQPSS